MKKDLAHVVLVVDRSRSMHYGINKTQRGIDSFILDQKTEEGNCTFTLLEFDSLLNYVYKNTKIKDVKSYTLKPRGRTSLNDAIGRAITDYKKKYIKTRKSQRPGLVSFTIVTDGMENSSREFSKNDVKKLIEECESKYDWKFNYLGSNQNAEYEGSKYGFKVEASSTYSNEKSEEAFLAATGKVKQMRNAARKGEIVFNSFTPQEKRSMS